MSHTIGFKWYRLRPWCLRWCSAVPDTPQAINLLHERRPFWGYLCKFTRECWRIEEETQERNWKKMGLETSPGHVSSNQILAWAMLLHACIVMLWSWCGRTNSIVFWDTRPCKELWGELDAAIVEYDLQDYIAKIFGKYFEHIFLEPDLGTKFLSCIFSHEDIFCYFEEACASSHHASADRFDVNLTGRSQLTGLYCARVCTCGKRVVRFMATQTELYTINVAKKQKAGQNNHLQRALPCCNSFLPVDKHVSLLVRRQGLPKIEALIEAGAVVVLFDFGLAHICAGHGRLRGARHFRQRSKTAAKAWNRFTWKAVLYVLVTCLRARFELFKKKCRDAGGGSKPQSLF